MLHKLLIPKFLISRSITIRFSLIRNLVLLILLTSGAILIVLIIGASHAIESLSLSLINRTTDQTESELKGLFEPVIRNLLIARQWKKERILDNEDTVSLNSLFMPILEQNPQISSMMIANSDGFEYLLLRVDDTWLNRITRADSWGKNALWYRWKNSKTMIDKYWKELDYDPRRRPWYKGAMNSEGEGSVNWTEPYTFFTTKDPGITASVRWKQNNKSDKTYVIAFDVLLIDISRFTTSQRVSKYGKSIVLTEEGLLLGLPRDERFRSVSALKVAVLSPVERIGVVSLAEAARNWKKKRTETNEPFRFKNDGEYWWGGFRPFQLGNSTFWIGVTVPESDFLAEVKRQRNYVIFVALGALGLAIVIATSMARTYSRPLERLALQSHRIRNLDLNSHQQIDSRLAEVNQLANAQEEMLSSIKSFARYVPVEVVRELLRKGEVARIGGRTVSLTVLFTDIRGFASIAEKMSPERLTAHMAEYFEGMLKILHSDKATVDKFMGDAICAFWGAPKPDPDHVENAVRAVLRCRKQLEVFNQHWEERGLSPLPTCFGLDTGSVVVGNVGAHSRLSYTVLGDTVNAAHRLEALNRIYGTEVLGSRKVRDEAGAEYLWRYVDVVCVKGKSKTIKIYELLGLKDDVTKETLTFTKSYEEALTLYQSGQFHKALELLRYIESYRPEDLSVSRLVQSCLHYVQHPPPEDWDGVVRFKEK